MKSKKPMLSWSRGQPRSLSTPEGRKVFLPAALLLFMGFAFFKVNADISFSLYTQDGTFYPALDALLQKPQSYIVGSASELVALPLFDQRTNSITVETNTTVAIFAGTFFSVFTAVPVKLWESQNGTHVVPALFDVRDGAELLMVGFTLSWSAVASSARQTNGTATSTASRQLPVLQPLLDRLRLYAEVAPTGKLQLLRTTIEGVTCDDLQRLYTALGILRNSYGSLLSLSGGVRPEMRFVYPYLFVKYAQVGAVWVEDMTVSCAATADLSPAACPPSPPTVYNISSHDDFLSALTTLEATDVPTCVTDRTILQLVTSVHLDTARWPSRSGGVFITSNVTIQGLYGQNLILDFGGGLQLFRIRGGAFVQISNLIIANLPLSPVGAYVVPMWSFQFNRDLSLLDEGRVHLVNTTGVVPTDEFVHLQYWTTILTNPTQAIAALAAWQRLIQRMELVQMSADSLTFFRLCGMGITGSNVIITSRTYNLTLVVPETGVNQLLGTDFRMGPPYIMAIYNAGMMARVLSTPDATLSRLAEQDGYTNGNSTRVLLLLQGNITLDRAAWPPGSALQLRRTYVVQGKPFTNVTLDFGAGTNYVTLLNSGAMQFKYLTLRNAGWAAEYNATTALQQLSPEMYMQSGMWPVTHERSGVIRVLLSSAKLLISRPEMDVLLACIDSYSANATSAVSLPSSLSREACDALFPEDAQVTSINRGTGAISVAAMHLDAYDTDGLQFLVDPDVSRGDLLQLLAGAYPTTASPPRIPGSVNDTTGAIVGGAVGGAVGCVLLVALLALYLIRRSRSRSQEKQLRNLQEKQTHQLEEIAGTNPLAQMILDHLAGRDPGVARLVVNGGGNGCGGGGGAAGSGSSATAAAAAATATGQGSTAASCNGGAGSGEVECTASTTPSANSGGVDGSPCKANGRPAGSSSGEAPGMAEDAVGLRDTRVNIAAADLAELFKHLTILGSPPTAAAGGNGHGSRSPRVRGSSPGSGSAAQPSSGASGGFTFVGFTHAMVARLQRRSGAPGTPAARGPDGAGRAGGGKDASSAGSAGKERNGAVSNSGSGAAPHGNAEGKSGAGGGCDKQTGADKSKADAESGGAEAAPAAPAPPALPQGLQEHVTQSPVLEELLRLSVDLAGEIDDNQLMVTDVVASGGFGTVYKGVWHNLPVAVKIVLFSTASVNRRIALQEAALSKSICHPNIISTYAVDAKPMTVMGRAGSSQRQAGSSAATSGGTGPKSKSLADIQEWRLYIIQEYADGGTLRRALDKGTFHEPYSGLPYLDMLLDISQGVAAALAHLHAKNVVHGDLNPKNVLLKALPAASRGAVAKAGWPGAAGFSSKSYLSPASQAAAATAASGTQLNTYPLVGRCGFAIKVADFGLSVKLADTSHISGLRQGTPFYASPELSQQGIFSRAADVYAFGVLLWELYWGRPIWVPDPSAPGGYVQHVNFPHLPPDCPHEYAALLADCLQLNHLQRPCFEEVLMRLRMIAHGAAREAATATIAASAAARPATHEVAAGPVMPGLPAAVRMAHAQLLGAPHLQAAAAPRQVARGAATAAGGAAHQQQKPQQRFADTEAQSGMAAMPRQPMVPTPVAASLSAEQQHLRRQQGQQVQAGQALGGEGAKLASTDATAAAAAARPAATAAAARGRATGAMAVAEKLEDCGAAEVACSSGSPEAQSIAVRKHLPDGACRTGDPGVQRYTVATVVKASPRGVVFLDDSVEAYSVDGTDVRASGQHGATPDRRQACPSARGAADTAHARSAVDADQQSLLVPDAGTAVVEAQPGTNAAAAAAPVANAEQVGTCSIGSHGAAPPARGGQAARARGLVAIEESVDEHILNAPEILEDC